MYTAGNRYGRLVLQEKTEKRQSGNVVWRCLCDCGKTTFVSTGHLGSGHTRSCGCLAKETRHKHGLSKTRIHCVWLQMKFRCKSEEPRKKHIYKDRGISVCKEWFNFIAFYDWAIANGYNDNLTIDRIDNNKGYSPNNCRWIRKGLQTRNLRRNIYITYDGREMLLAEAAEIAGVKYNTAYQRYKKGREIDVVFKT